MYERMKRPERHEAFTVWKKHQSNDLFLPVEALEDTSSPMYIRTNDDATVALLL